MMNPSSHLWFSRASPSAKKTLLANGLDGESSKTRDARFTRRISHQPGEEASHIHRSGDDHMLHMRLGLPNGATATQITHTDALRNRPFDAGSCGRPLFELLCLLPGTRHVNGVMMGLRTKGHVLRIGSRCGPLGTRRASETLLLAELGTNDMRHMRRVRIVPDRPCATGCALWAGHDPLISIDGTLADVVGLFVSGLPTAIAHHGTKSFSRRARLGVHDVIPIDLSRIHEML